MYTLLFWRREQNHFPNSHKKIWRTKGLRTGVLLGVISDIHMLGPHQPRNDPKKDTCPQAVISSNFLMNFCQNNRFSMALAAKFPKYNFLFIFLMACNSQQATWNMLCKFNLFTGWLQLVNWHVGVVNWHVGDENWWPKSVITCPVIVKTFVRWSHSW